ncbi:hypothetical protein vseg_008751 [Gypsophila vaccaria]
MSTTPLTYTPYISTTLETNLTSHTTNTSLTFPTTSHSSTSLHVLGPRRTRRLRTTTATRAGPSTNQLIFAFVFPFSLLAVTAFTAFQIGNRLDQKFLDELAMIKALREEDDDDDNQPGQVPATRKEEPALPQSRNRPRREI